MKDAVKFTFDTEFSRDGQILRERQPRPKTRFSPEEMEAAKAQGFAEGQASAEAEATRAAAQATAEALEIVKTGLAHILSTLQGEVDAVRAEGARLAFETVRHLTAGLVDRHGADHVAGLIAEGLQGVREAPTVTITLAPDLAQDLGPRIAETAAAAGFEGQVEVKDDGAVQRADCRLTWGRGGALSDLEGAIAAVETLIRDHLEAEGNTQLSLFDL
ncbi:MAG: hypothetical protein ACFB6R_04435 [Alphaproteobacteria bacterium]